MLFINILLFSVFALQFFIYQNSQIQSPDLSMLTMMSLVYGLGILSILKSIEFFILKKKKTGEVVSINPSDVNTGKVQDVGSYSRGYSYGFLIEGEEYFMPKYFHFGSKYNIGDKIKVSILNSNKKTALPVKAIFNIFLIGLVALYISNSVRLI